MVRLLTVILALSLSGLVPALAASAKEEAVRTACQADVKAQCGLVFTRGQAIDCLVKNAGKLSAECVTAVKAASCSPKAPDNLKAAFPCAE